MWDPAGFGGSTRFLKPLSCNPAPRGGTRLLQRAWSGT
jgi:hypothetical protein